MMISFLIFIFCLAILYTRIKLIYPLIVFFLTLFFVLLLVHLELNDYILYVTSFALILTASLFLVTPLRGLFIYPLFNKFINTKKSLISNTERGAIECGDVHWEYNLLSADLDWHKLLSVKQSNISNNELDFIKHRVPKLCHLFNEFGLSDVVLRAIKSEGFWSINIPKKYGGLEFSVLAHSRIITLLSSCDVSLAVTVMVPNSLGPAQLIERYGTSKQKDFFLPRLATGDEIPCFALTSLDAGSDAGSMTDTGIVCHRELNGKRELGLLLNWDKRFTTLAPISTLIGLAFKSYDPNHLIGSETDLGITCALVPSNLKGIEIGKLHKPIGSNFSNGPHCGVDVFIPMSSVIGGQGMVGKGWPMLMESLSIGRGISIPALSLSGLKISLKSSIEYSLVRKQFNRSLFRFQGVAERIVPMAADLLEANSMSSFHLQLLDNGMNPSVSSAILKYNHTEALRRHVNNAMDIHAGKSIMLGKRNYLANIYSVIPIAITVEGANILTRSMIIFGQGLLRCHPFLKGELDSLDDGNFKKFNHLIGQHLSYTTRSIFKTMVFSLSNGALCPAPEILNHAQKPHYKSLIRLSSSYSFLVEMLLLTYGSKLKFNESINGLFADLLVNMYGISTTLRNAEKLDDDFNNLINWYMQQRVYEAQLLIKDICDQLKFSFLYRWMVLPWWYNFSRPPISLQNSVMNDLIFNSAIKDELTQDTFIGKNSSLALLDTTFNLAITLEPIYKKVGYFATMREIDCLLDKEQINIDEHKLMINYHDLRNACLEVDEYEN